MGISLFLVCLNTSNLILHLTFLDSNHLLFLAQAVFSDPRDLAPGDYDIDVGIKENPGVLNDFSGFPYTATGALTVQLVQITGVQVDTDLFPVTVRSRTRYH